MSTENKKHQKVSTFDKLLNTIKTYPAGMMFYIDRDNRTMIRYAQGFVNIYAINFVRKNKKHNIYKIVRNNFVDDIKVADIMNNSRIHSNALDCYVV